MVPVYFAMCVGNYSLETQSAIDRCLFFMSFAWMWKQSSKTVPHLVEGHDARPISTLFPNKRLLFRVLRFSFVSLPRLSVCPVVTPTSLLGV